MQPSIMKKAKSLDRHVNALLTQKPNPITRANSLPSKYTELEKSSLQNKFKSYYKTYVSQLSKIINEPTLPITGEIKEMNVYYFIGRLNPPHAGHIKTLKSLIETAKKTNGKVIILLGSGPNKGARTLDDPLDFELKRQVVIALLGDDYTSYQREIDIIEMDKAAVQITDIIQQDINSINDIIIKIIKTFRFSSTKEGDDKKLNWIETAIKKREFTAPNGDKITINTNVIGINPSETSTGKAMSATQVRKDALRGFIADGLAINPDGPGYKSFAAKYSEFYGPYTGAVYTAIIGQTNGLSEAEIQAYIDSGTLPKTKKRGGSRKRRKTKRRKSRKHRKSKRRRH